MADFKKGAFSVAAKAKVPHPMRGKSLSEIKFHRGGAAKEHDRECVERDR
jgi:hypothetical protein